MDEQQNLEELKLSIGAVLNRHGHSFQYAVLRTAEEECQAGRSKWFVEVSEFPIRVHGRDAKIDFILRDQLNRVFLIGECKRANPAYADWCFVRAPYVCRNDDKPDIVAERIDTNFQIGVKFLFGELHEQIAKPYHLALEVKTNQPGDAQGAKGEAIEDAAVQVCRGVNGFVETLVANRSIWKWGAGRVVFPVIFTTADLYVCDVDLQTADLTTGKVDTSSANVTKRDWVFYQYHQSVSTKHLHGGAPEELRETLSKELYQSYVRTIAVVSAGGIPKFLEWSSRSVSWD